MNKAQTFQEFLATQSVEVPILGFILNLFLAAFLSFVLSRVYEKYGYSLSNRRMFAKNFMLLSTTTLLIITIVKSSLALSLGLVGALSIVRFRSAIKEPEELAYLFLCIAIGLGFGADQSLITIVAFIIIVGMIWLKNFSYKTEDHHNLYLTVRSTAPEKLEIKQIVEILRKFCAGVSLKRFDEREKMLEASFLVEFADFDALEKSKAAMQELDGALGITFLDNKGIG